MRTETWWGTAMMMLCYIGCIFGGVVFWTMFPIKPEAEGALIILCVLMIGTGILGPTVYFFTGEFPMDSYDF